MQINIKTSMMIRKIMSGFSTTKNKQTNKRKTKQKMSDPNVRKQDYI